MLLLIIKKSGLVKTGFVMENYPLKTGTFVKKSSDNALKCYLTTESKKVLSHCYYFIFRSPQRHGGHRGLYFFSANPAYKQSTGTPENKLP